MPRRNSPFRHLDVFSSTAVLAAQAVFQLDGFRQRDVKFFMQLFSNWLEHSVGEETPELSNTQIQRYLGELCDEGFARRIQKKKQVPTYLLTRVGIIEVLRSITEAPLFRRPGRLIFVCYFLKSYRGIILDLLEAGSPSFPPALKLEIVPLLDGDRLRKRQTELAEKEMAKLDFRASDSMQMSITAARLYKSGTRDEEAILALEKKHPYQLNSQKPLHELLESFPPGQARWEVTEGAKARSELLWTPMRELWRSILKVINS